MGLRLNHYIASALAGAVLLFASAAAAQVPGGVSIKPPFVTGDCVKSAGAGAISTTGTPCGGGGAVVSSFSAGTTGFTPSSPTTGAVVLSGTLGVPNGGTGAASFTAHGILLGNGSGALGLAGPCTTGQVLLGVTGSDPVCGALTSNAVTSLSFGTTGLTPNSATQGAITVAGTLGFANGGTSNTSYTDGQLLIGNSATGGLSKATLTQGANVTITNGNGTITIAASGSGGTGCTTSGTNTSVLTDNGSGGCTSNPAFQYSSGTATLGTAGSVVGSVALKNATSGTLTLSPPTGALGTVTVTVPDATDTLVNLASAQALTNKTITFAGNTLTGVAPLASPTFTGTVTIPTPFTLGAVSVTSTGTQLNYLSAATGTTGTASTNVVYSASPTFTGTAAFAALSATGQFTSTLSTGTAPFVVASTTNVANLNASTLTGSAVGTSGATIPLLNGANTWSGVQSVNSGDLALKGATSGTITLNAAATAGSNTLTLPAGTTDFSATGGTSQVVKQVTTGAAFTVARLACADLSDSGAGCSSAGGGSAPVTKTSNFNASAGATYAVDTSGGAVTATLPGSPSNGDTILFLDKNQNFAVANLILGRNSLTIMNSATDLTVNTTTANFHVTYVSDTGTPTWIMW